MNGFEKRRLEKMTRIEAAARRLFREEGMASVSMERIAAAAGVSKVTLYKYYGDRQSLARKLVFDALNERASEFDRIAQSALSFQEKIDALLGTKSAVFLDLGGGLMDGTLLDAPEARTFFEQYNEERTLPIMEALIAQGRREGAIHPDIPAGAILSYIRAVQSLLASPLSTLERKGLGRLFLYGLLGKP